MPVGDIHIAGPGGWALCGASGPVNGYNATSRSCVDCESIEWQARQGIKPGEPARRKTFRIINGENGYGLSRDRDIISDAFVAAGWDRVGDHAWALIHLERVDPYALPHGVHNIVIPNPEWWCSVGNVGIAELNQAVCHPSARVWAKTGDAERIFTSFGARVETLGFRSHNRYDGSIYRERSFLHVAGIGPNKRTERLIEMWRPEWPRLTVTSGVGSSRENGNVRVIVDRISDSDLRTLQNRHLFHIYPSRYEGFGHAQWEGLSCGAFVFTTDGPPFNEHPTAFRLLSSVPNGHPPWNPSVQWRDVTHSALADMVAAVQSLTDDDIVNYRLRHRAYWENSQVMFLDRIRSAILSLGET